ncbi:dihydroneopterin aldolase [Myxococcota bacterium]|nr:dihydroneopterin aldolase [Myxococcota bacterium]MBU1533901.1 dihydroneopterin aldolase [Myxococcota bacterium]
MIQSIGLRAIRFETSIGCLPTEFEKKTPLECDVLLTIEREFTNFDSYDTLDHTFDYRLIETILLEVARTRHFNMMESLGHLFLQTIIIRFPFIRKGTITLRKPGALASGAIPEVTMVWPDGR